MNSENPIRVRFAPSPTGFLHVGNVRTALFNWLLAGRHGGTFVLRIEDTDAARSEPRFERQLVEDLSWLGLDWSEGIDRGGEYGPYRQTDRYDLYRRYAARLLDEDRAYRCFCSAAELEETRRLQLERRETPRYAGTCRRLPPDEIRERVGRGDPFTLRLRVRPGCVGFDDLVFGRIEIETSQVSDPVLVRSDGSPTYNFCCVVDDLLMRISHVVRGDGHLSNTHRQVLIYEALSAEPPRFAHLSTILGPDGQKLSKRHGATSIEDFRRRGYLPEALVNYLALLGWSPPEDGREVLALDEIREQFDLGRVQKSPAIFDTAKLDWMNRTWIIRTPGAELLPPASPFFVAAGLLPAESSPALDAWAGRVIDLVKTRVDHLDQLPEAAEVVYGADPPALDADARAALAAPEGREVALDFVRRVEAGGALTPEGYRRIVGEVKSATGRKGRHLYHPIRAVLTGRGSGPDLETLAPLCDEGARLPLPRPVLSPAARARRILEAV